MLKRTLSIALSILILSSVLTACKSQGTGEQEAGEYADIVKIVYNDDIHRVYIPDGSNKAVYSVNNEKVKDIAESYEAKDFIVLPDTSENNDLSGQGLITDKVYEADLNTSAAYLNFLENSGYKVVYEADTYKFKELFLEKDAASLLKRLIITREYIIVSETSEIPDIVIENYLFK